MVSTTPTAGSRQAASRRETHKLVIAANRLPVRFQDGSWETSPGGLVRALLPLLRASGGGWVGWTGNAAHHEPFAHEGVSCLPVPMDEQEVATSYDGFANSTLWPLFHDAIRPSNFDPAWWQGYLSVNRRFAAAVARTVAPCGQAWVHDYHLLLVPAMLRRLRPDIAIGFFLHIPFPPPELFARLPWRQELLKGLLGADVVGFQTDDAADNFRRTLTRLGLDQPPEMAARTHIGTYPISIDVAEIERIARQTAVLAAARALRASLGSPDRVLVGVDRLDYTKAIDQRLEVFAATLRKPQLSAQSVTFVQVAVPSRDGVEAYTREREHIERVVSHINGNFGRIGAPAIHYLHQNLSLADLVALYLAADVAVVTPWRDGMNLVAKEYVASRTNATGSIVLSEFAGAAQELTDAIVVNPYDNEGFSAGLLQALAVDPAQPNDSMRCLRQAVSCRDVHAWAADFLAALEMAKPCGVSTAGLSGR